jgi:hypothetical protein
MTGFTYFNRSVDPSLRLLVARPSRLRSGRSASETLAPLCRGPQTTHSTKKIEMTPRSARHYTPIISPNDLNPNMLPIASIPYEQPQPGRRKTIVDRSAPASPFLRPRLPPFLVDECLAVVRRRLRSPFAARFHSRPRTTRPRLILTRTRRTAALALSASDSDAISLESWHVCLTDPEETSSTTK